MMRWACLLTCACAGLALLSGFPERLPGESSPPNRPVMRRVPADDPSLWPAGDWRSLPREPFQRFLESLSTPADAVVAPLASLWEQTYAGVLSGDLLSGDCRLVVHHSRAAAGAVVLQPLGLALTGLRWQDEDAIWGLRADGRTVVWTDGQATDLTGRWKLRGRRLLDRLEFEVQVPTSGVARLVLDLPENLALTASAGVVSAAGPSPIAGHQRWNVDLGRRTRTRLLCEPRRSATARNGGVFARESLLLTAHGEGVDVQLDLELEGAVGKDLQYRVPPELSLVTATLGSDQALPFTQRLETGSRLVTFQLPETLPARGTRVRLRGFQPMLWTGLQRLPALRAVNATPIDHQLTLHVRPPRQVQEFQTDGYRLVDQRVDSERTETLVFQGLRRDPDLTVEVAEPTLELSAELAELADYRGPIPRADVAIRVTGVSGAGFQLRARLPQEWDVATVAPFRGESDTIIAGTHVVPAGDGRHLLLLVDFRRAIEPGAELDLRVTLIGRPITIGSPTSPPWLTLPDATRVSGLMAIIPPAGTEVSSLAPFQAAHPSGAMMDRLRNLDSTGALPSAVYLDLRDLSRRTGVALQFDAPGTVREPVNDLSRSPEAPVMPIGDAQRPVSRPMLSDLRLTSYLAAAGSRTHWHEATFQLRRGFQGDIRLALDSSAIVVDVQLDGTPVPFARVGGTIRPQATSGVQETLRVRYRTAAATERLQALESAPVPVWDDEHVPLEWRIVPSEARVCSGVQVPFSRVLEANRLPARVRWLGPLARTDTLVTSPRPGPAGAANADGPAGDEAGGAMRPSSGVLRVEVAVSPAVLRFETWNTHTASRAAWACLMGVLLLAVSLRRRRSARLRMVAPLWMAALAVIAQLVPESLALPAGGCVAGALLAVALPRRLVMPRSRDERDSTTAGQPSGPTGPGWRAPAVQAGIVLALCCLRELPGDEPLRSVAPAPPAASPSLTSAGATSTGSTTTGAVSTAPTDVPTLLPGEAVDVLLPERDGEPARKVLANAAWADRFDRWWKDQGAPPAWLIRQATYDIDVTDEPRVRAVYEVLTPVTATSSAVRLPLRDMTFPSTDSAQIDGRRTVLIPTPLGDGVVIPVPPAAEASTLPLYQESVTRWQTHRIEIEALTALLNLRQRAGIQMGIPAVADATVRLRPADQTLRDYIGSGLGGTVVDAQQGAVIEQIGPVPRIESSWTRTSDAAPLSPKVATPLRIATLMEVYPLRLDGRSSIVLPLPESGAWPTWTVPLTPGTVLIDVAAPPELEWIARSSADGTVIGVQALQPLTAPPTIVVHTLRAIDASRDPARALTISPVIQGSPGAEEWVGLRAAPGFDLEPGAVSDAGTPTLLSANDIAADPRSAMLTTADRVYGFTAGQLLAFRLEPRKPELSVDIETTLRVRRSEADWSASVTVDVQRAPTPAYELQLDRAVVLQSVSVLQDGAERLARFVREGDRVSLVLSRPYSGTQVIRMSGTLPLAAGVDVPLPRLQMPGATVRSQSGTVFDDSGWEVLIDGRTPRLATPSSSASAGDSSTRPPILVYSEVSGPIPTSFRLVPGPDAAVVDLVTQILPTEQGSWLQRVFGSVRPQGAPLGLVRLVLPPDLTVAGSVSPAADIVETTTDASGLQHVVLKPSRAQAGAYRFLVQSPMEVPEQASVWESRRVTCESAVIGERWLLLDSRFPFRPTSASGELADWDDVPPRLQATPRPGTVLPYRMARDLAVWTWASHNPGQAAPALTLMESVAWWDPQQGIEGRTSLNIVTSGPERLRLQLPTGLELESVMVDGRPIAVESRTDLVEIPLSAPLQGGFVVAAWHGKRGELSYPRSLAFPRPLDWTPSHHLAVLVPVTGRSSVLSGAVTPEAATAEQMAGLLEAVERQSTRTFAIDSPLLAALRATDLRLERLLESGTLSFEQRRQYQALRDRWQQVHRLIAVKSEVPGAPVHSGEFIVDLIRQDILADPDVSVAILPTDQWIVTIEHNTGLSRWIWGAALIVIGGLALALLVAWHGAELCGDWLADRPAVASLLLGGFWIAMLQPRIVGVLIVLAGLSLLLPRRRPRDWQGDTALVGPGR